MDLSNGEPTRSVPPPQPPPPGPPPVPKPPPVHPSAPARITSIIAAVTTVVASSGLIFFLYLAWMVASDYFERYQVQIEAQRHWMENRGSHQKEILALKQKIAETRAHGTALPSCPLVYPLLDKKGRVSPLGSYMSLRAMEQATYLPQAVYQLSSEVTNFSAFNLFQSPNYLQENYTEQLPYYFETKDFAEGTLVPSGKGYRLRLRFWGSKPEKVYEVKLKARDLHLGIGWMAARIHEWTGYKPTPKEEAFFKKPIFTTDEALQYAASQQYLFDDRGALLATHWEYVTAHSSDLPCVRELTFEVLKAREEGSQMVSMLELVKKYPDSTCGKSMVMDCYYGDGQYDKAMDIAWDLLGRDLNNPDWNQWAACTLEYKDQWEGAIELLKSWTQAQPQNPEAWIMLAQHMLTYSGGNTWAKSADFRVVKLHDERVREGLADAQKAVELAPGYAKAWAELEAFGGPARLDEKTVEGYFQKALSLDPNSYLAYENYMAYLQSRPDYHWDVGYAFAKKAEPHFPHFLAEVAVDAFTLPAVEGGDEKQAERLEAIREKIRTSPYWKDYQRSVQAYLAMSPEDLGEWDSYLQWADLAGKTDSLFVFAKKISARRPELKALYPNLLIAYPKAAARNRILEKDRASFWSDPKITRQEGDAYRQLSLLDPQNWDVLNHLAKYDLESQNSREARKIFRRIGTHWAKEVWTMEEFETARASVAGPYSKHSSRASGPGR